jgi:hypothetical protein
MISIITSAMAPVNAHIAHWSTVQQKPSQKIGAKNTNTMTEKMKLSKN